MPTPTFPEPPAKPSISPADAIAAIGRGDPKVTELIALSDLAKVDARSLALVWPTVPEEVRVRVLRQLDELAENDVQYRFNRVFRIALNDESAAARQIAISALWEDDGTDLIERFIVMLRDDSSVDVRAQAATGLGAFADMAANEEIDEDLSSVVKRVLLDYAADTSESSLVRRRALESVAFFGTDRDIEALIVESFEADDTPVRASAVFAMGRTSDRRWLPRVIAEFESTDVELRFEAARAAGEVGHVDAVSGLAALIGDDDDEVRQAAIYALGKIGGPGAIRVLRANLRSATPADRAAIDEAIEEATIFADLEQTVW